MKAATATHPQAAPALATRARGRCLLCGTSDDPIVWSEGQYHARQCPCGVLYVDPAPRPGEVDPTRDGHSDGYYRLPAGARFAFVRRYAPGRRLLEVGFGRGHVLALARRAGFSVTGVEANPAAVGEARACGSDVEHAMIETSAVPERAFDVIFHVDLLSHFPDPVAALDAMRRRLRPGGVLIFEVGVMGGLDPRWHRWWDGLGLPEHRNMFSEVALDQLLARAGLERVATRRYSLLLGLAVLRARHMVEAHIDRHLPRPRDPTGLPPIAGGIHAVYEHVMMWARYTAGRLLPRWGRLTLFVVARERGGH